MARKEKEIQSLQERVIELERKLAEAQATIQALTPLKQSSPRINSDHSYEQRYREMRQSWEQEKANSLASEERLQSALIVVPHPLMIRRDDGQVIMVNAAWTKISGYTLEEIPTIDEWARKAYGEGSSERKSEILNEGFSQSDIKHWGEYEITTRSGEKRIWDFSTAPLGVDEQGRRLVMAMAVDVTEHKKAEEELRAARDEAKWLARFPGENPNPVARVSDKGIVLYCNAPAASLRGWRCATQAMLPRPLLDLVELAIEQDQVVEQDVSLGDKFYSVSVIPLLKQGYLNLYGRDITERRLAEKALEESERRQREITRLLELDQARLAAILRHLPVGVWIVDEQGRLMGSNPEAERIWAGEVPLDSPADFLNYVSWHPGSEELLRPEEYPITVALRTGEPVQPMELNIRRFDGSEGAVLASAVPIKDGRGGLIGVVAANVDIAERKQMEEALKASNDRVNDILRSLGGGLLALDRHWSIIYINEEAVRVAGLPVEKLIRKNLWELWPELLGTPLEGFYRQAMQEGVAGQRRIRGIQSSRWYDVNVSPSSEGITIFYEDKTEQILAEERFNKAFHASPNALVISRQQDGRIELINDTFVRFFGYNREEALGKTSVELGMFADPTDRQEAVQRLQKEGSVRDFELDVRLKSGEVRNASLSIERIEIGGEHMMLTTIQDITLRKQAEQALRESEERYRGLFEQMQEGLVAAEMVMDEQGKAVDYRYLDVNPATERQFGISRERFVGRTYTEVLPEGDPEWIDIFARVARTGEPVSLERYGRASKRWFECHIYSPRPGQVVNISTDITERKQTEEHIAYQAKLLANVNDAIVGSDAEFRLTAWNAAAETMYGWKAEEVLGRNGVEILQTQWPEEDAKEMRRVIAEYGRWRGEASQLRKDGTRIPVEVSSMVLRDESGQIISYVSVNRDITERKKAESHINDLLSLNEKILNHSSVGILTYKVSGQCVFANEKVASIVGTRVDHLLTQNFHTIEAWKKSGLYDLVQRAISTEAPATADIHHLSTFGKDIWVTVHCITFQSKGEEHVLLSMSDITERKNAEEALRKSEERFAKAFHASPDAIIISRLSDGLIMEVNEGWSKIFGHKSNEVMGQSTLEVGVYANPEDRETAIAYLREKGRLRDFEVQIRRKSGEIRQASLSAERIEINGVECLLAIIEDITDRKQAEQALLESEKRLNRAQEIAHLGSWELDVINNKLTWSDEVYRIFGLEPQEFGATYEAFLEAVHPQDRAAVDAAYSGSIREGRDQYEIEHRVVRRNGEIRIVHEKCEHFHAQSGQIIRSIGMVHDITERKQAEEALQESETRFRSLADSMPQLVWTALPDGTVDYYNQRYREYREIRQVEGAAWEWASVLHPDDLQPTIDAWQRSVETGDIYQIEHRVRMADGSYRWHLSRGVPMRDEAGQIIRWFGTATDIHDLKLAEEQLKVYAERLERSNRELEQFAFMASHDLQEPLRKIEMFGDMLLERATCLSDQERNYIERMRNASGRMRDMVEGLLQLSRITTQGKPFIPVDLSQMTSEVLHDLEGQIRRTSGKVKVETLPTIEGDALQLRQLMQNLIGNALKYHQPGIPPEIKVYAKQLAGKLQIRVEDQGIGFAQEDAERIFQPFQRLVGHSQYEGSGMGLAICRRIVERHRGEIAAFSEPGHGTTVIVTLPGHHSERVNEARKDASNEESGITPGR